MRRWLLVAGIGFLLVAGVTLAARASLHVPWDAMESDVAGAPVPEGYIATPVSRAGEKCLLSPSCQWPLARRDVEETPGMPDLSCDLARSIAGGWPEFEQSDEYADSSVCSVRGRIHGRYAEVSYFGPEQSSDTGERFPAQISILVSAIGGGPRT